MRKQSSAELTKVITVALRRSIVSAVLFNQQVASRLGISAGENQFLHLLELYGPLSPGQLATFTGLSSGTVTGVLDRLEQGGFVRRDHDLTDRRKIVITAEADRMADIAPMFAGQAHNLTEILGGYQPSELTTIAGFLSRLADTIPEPTESRQVISETRIPLSSEEQSTLKTAAFGAVTLLSVAYPGARSSAKENMVGGKVLTGATGIVGHILVGKAKFNLKGKSTADIAERVLPALAATVATLDAKAPQETQEFRRVVTTAIRQAAQSTKRGPSPAQTDMISKITAALDASLLGASPHQVPTAPGQTDRAQGL